MGGHASPQAFYDAAAPGSWLERLPGVTHLEFCDAGAVGNWWLDRLDRFPEWMRWVAGCVFLLGFSPVGSAGPYSTGYYEPLTGKASDTQPPFSGSRSPQDAAPQQGPGRPAEPDPGERPPQAPDTAGGRPGQAQRPATAHAAAGVRAAPGRRHSGPGGSGGAAAGGGGHVRGHAGLVPPGAGGGACLLCCC